MAWLAVALLTFSYALGLLAPFEPASFTPEPDPSVSLALHSLFANGSRFGSEAILPAGPFGFIYTRSYHPATFWLTLTSWTFFATCLWLAGYDIVRRRCSSPWISALWLAALIGSAAAGPDQALMSLSILLCVLYFDREDKRPTAIVLILAIATAWASLIKVSFLALGMLVTCIVTIDETARKRRAPVVLAVFAATFLALWCLDGQHLADLWPFLNLSRKLGGAYAEAAALEGSHTEIAAFLVGGLSFLTVAAGLELGRRGGWGLLPLAGFAAIVHLLFRAAYVRHDEGHAPIGAFGLLVLIISYFPGCRAGLGPRRATRYLVPLMLGVIAVSLSFAPASGANLSTYWIGTAVRLPKSLAAGASLLRGTSRLRASHERNMASIRAENPIPPLAGAVDIYPDRQAVVIAHGVAYQPRPSIQSHLAYLPELAEANARHLHGEHAPDHILLDVRTIDDRFPSLDDGLSWPELLTRYDVCDVTENFLVLEKAGNPRAFRLSPISESSTSLGAAIPVPGLDQGPVWAQVDLRPTLFGIVAGQLYKPPVVAITTTTSDGRQRRFRMIPALARRGFLLSPLVASRLEFALLASGAWERALAPAEVTRLVIAVDRSRGGFYRNDLRVSFLRLDAPRQSKGIHPRDASLANLYALAGHASRGDAEPRVEVGPQGTIILMAHAASQMVLALDKEVKRLRIGFGLLDGAWRNGGRTDGVLFRISVRSGDRSAVVWSRFLDPVRNPEDRGTQQGAVELEGRHATALVFETLPGANGLWDWSYWSRAEVE